MSACHLNIKLLAPSVARYMWLRKKTHVGIYLELNAAYSGPQGYYSNLVKALGKSTAPAVAQWREVAGGGM